MNIETLEKIKGFYEEGIYTLDTINKMLEAGKINDAEYTYIVGEN